MTLAEVLEEVYCRGLQLVLGEDLQPRLKGRRSQMTEEVLALVREHRQAILARLQAPPRRIVLLVNGPRSEVEQVLWEGDPRGHHSLCRRFGQDHPGRQVAAEWRLTLPGSPERWKRFLVLRYPANGERVT